MSNFILTTGILDIGTKQLSLDTNFVENGNAVAFSATKMIETSADHGARGLKYRMDGDYTSSTVTFPLSKNPLNCKFIGLPLSSKAGLVSLVT